MNCRSLAVVMRPNVAIQAPRRFLFIIVMVCEAGEKLPKDMKWKECLNQGPDKEIAQQIW